MVMHVKGLELPGYDPRGMKGQGLTYAVSDRGACHVRSNTLRTEFLIPGADRYGYEGKALMVSELQLNYVIYDILISCAFGGLAIVPTDYAEAVSAITGWSFSQEELRKAAQRVWTLHVCSTSGKASAERMINFLSGFLVSHLQRVRRAGRL